MTPTYQSIDWYDLPKYYEAVFAAETPLEADFLETMMERHACVPLREILEPACGSGRLVIELGKRGYRITGFDANEEMLQHARERVERQRLTARLETGLLQDFSFSRRFDLSHCLVSTFKYVLTESEARAHLHLVAKHLRPGGLYVLGFHLTEYMSRKKIRERWDVKSGRSRIICNIQIWPADRRKRLERVRSRLRVTTGHSEKRFETEWVFRTYDARQVRQLLRTVPTLEHVATYDFSYDPDCEIELNDEQLDVVLVLRKKVV